MKSVIPHITLSNWVPCHCGTGNPSILSDLLLWSDDTLNILAAKYLHDLNKAVKAFFKSFEKFAGDYGISFHFNKFEIVFQWPIEYNVRGKSNVSKKEGTYLGYTIEQNPRYAVPYWQKRHDPLGKVRNI